MCDWQIFLLGLPNFFWYKALTPGCLVHITQAEDTARLKMGMVQCLSFWLRVSRYHVWGMNTLGCQSSKWTQLEILIWPICQAVEVVRSENSLAASWDLSQRTKSGPWLSWCATTVATTSLDSLLENDIQTETQVKRGKITYDATLQSCNTSLRIIIPKLLAKMLDINKWVICCTDTCLWGL